MPDTWERQDPSTGFPTVAKTPLLHRTPKEQRSAALGTIICRVSLLPGGSLFSLKLWQIVYLDGTQGESVCGYISHPADCMAVVEGDRGHLSEEEIKLKCRKQSDISSTLQFVG